MWGLDDTSTLSVGHTLMSKKITQLEIVKARIEEVGYVDNFWAIENYILRLGAIMHTLSHEHKMLFRRAFGKELGKEERLWKNFYYIREFSESPLVEKKELEKKTHWCKPEDQLTLFPQI